MNMKKYAFNDLNNDISRLSYNNSIKKDFNKMKMEKVDQIQLQL